MAHWQIKLVSLATFFGLIVYLISSLLLLPLIHTPFYLVTIFIAPLTCLLIILTVLCLHIASLKPSDSHTLPSLLKQYRAVMSYKMGTSSAYHKFVKSAEKCKEAQEETLLKILQKNSDTEYGKDYDLGSVTSREDFVTKQPLTSYSCYEKYVEKIKNGEINVLTKDKVVYLASSSGTTGKRKLFPKTKGLTSSVKENFLASIYGMRNHFLRMRLRRVFHFTLTCPPKISRGGIPIGSAGQFTAKGKDYDIVPMFCKQIFKLAPSFYVQSVLVLREADVSYLQAFSGDLLISLFRFMEDNLQDICQDISLGVIHKVLDLDESIRIKINQQLTPAPDRAEAIRNIFKEGRPGIALRLWRNLNSVMVCKTGSFAHSAELLKQSHLQGVSLIYRIHAASEGLFGICVESDPQSDILTFVPDSCFLEFIPVEEMEEENPKCLFMDQVELGQCYELVVTNVHGLYRNRFGDIVKIVDFLKNTPKYTFQYRAGQILNVAFEKTPEVLLYRAIQLTEKRWGHCPLTDYTAVESSYIEDVSGKQFNPGRYVVFIEIEFTKDKIQLTEEKLTMFDENLCEIDDSYKECRECGKIGPMMVIQVKPGTFGGVQEIMMENSNNGQFKMPRVMRKPEVLSHLWVNRV